MLTDVDFNGNGVYTDSGKAIAYDNIGNPASYLGATLTWEGRELSTYTKGTTSVSYTYDADGLRSQKTVPVIKTEYI